MACASEAAREREQTFHSRPYRALRAERAAKEPGEPGEPQPCARAAREPGEREQTCHSRPCRALRAGEREKQRQRENLRAREPRVFSRASLAHLLLKLWRDW